MFKMTNFIDKDLPINSWQDLEPYFTKMFEMTINSKDDLELLIYKLSDVLSVYREQDARSYINMTCDTNNEEFLKRHQLFNEKISPFLNESVHQIEEKILNSEFLPDIDQKYFSCFLQSLKKEVEMFRKENIPLQTELSKLSTQYSQIAGSLKVNLDGKELTIPQAGTYLKKANRELRKNAYQAISTERLKNKDLLNDLFTEMVLIRDQMAKNAGFDNFRDYKHEDLHRFDYTPQDVLNFHDAIQKHVLPLDKQITQKHIQEIGLTTDDYKPWDVAAVPQDKTPLKPYENSQELLQKTKSIFGKLHPDFKKNLEAMEKAKLFDLDSRKGKAPGGYNYHLEITGMPFIFMNSANTHSDMTTLMHEGGHAMHSFLTNFISLINYRHTNSEMAETASMSMELMTSPYWNEFYSEQDCKRARLEHLEDIVKTFTWVATVDKFQHWIYLNPNCSIQERNDSFVSIYKEFNPNLVNWQGYENNLQNLWHKQLHIFEVPFYYIEYAIAQLGALQIYKNYKANPKKTIQDYINGLKLGGTISTKEVWNAMNIRFDFSEENLKSLMTFLQDEIACLQK